MREYAICTLNGTIIDIISTRKSMEEVHLGILQPEQVSVIPLEFISNERFEEYYGRPSRDS